eukprot:Blabericola_migrator_1__8257@NODE_427_length_8589_cov_62_998123_g337_i0_p3_GENE_NODE_427_length_8589_cov_62_998123_g337_i0NODE_427_length_8589_cov_62_998123_g337_i0_p3_ORF_typecomplete_len364_score58_16ANAPC4_WD40/PF12894_7/4_2ANAPC4_WD40/PF12894_7/1_6e02_NODE_427_length_8589_cov_62_998123_g337_i073728463
MDPPPVRYDVPPLKLAYRLFLSTPSAAPSPLVNVPPRRPPPLRSLNFLDSTIIVQNRASVSLITLENQEGFFSHSVDVVSFSGLPLHTVWVYGDVPSLFYSFHCPSISNTDGFQLGLLDLHTRRERFRSPVIYVPPECVGPTANPSCLFSLHTQGDSEVFFWDLRAKRSHVSKASLDFRMASNPPTALAYLPGSSLLVLGHDNGLLSRWQISFPYKGKGVQLIDYIRTPGTGPVTSIDSLSNKHLMVGIYTRDTLRLLDLPPSLEIPKGCRSSSSISESIIIPEADSLSCAPQISSNGLLATAYEQHLDVWHLQSKEVLYQTSLVPNRKGEAGLDSLLWLSPLDEDNPVLVSSDSGCIKVWTL